MVLMISLTRFVLSCTYLVVACSLVIVSLTNSLMISMVATFFLAYSTCSTGVAGTVLFVPWYSMTLIIFTIVYWSLTTSFTFSMVSLTVSGLDGSWRSMIASTTLSTFSFFSCSSSSGVLSSSHYLLLIASMISSLFSLGYFFSSSHLTPLTISMI